MRLNKAEAPKVDGAKEIDLKKELRKSGKTFRAGTVVEFFELDDDTNLNDLMQSHPFESDGQTQYSDKVLCTVNGKIGWHNISKFTYFNRARNTHDFDAYIQESSNNIIDAIRKAITPMEFYQALAGKQIVFNDEFTFVFTDFKTQQDREHKLAVYTEIK